MRETRKLINSNEQQLRSELAKANHFFRETLKHMPVVFYAKQPDGKYIDINREFEHLFNWEREQIIGRVDHDLFPKEVADQFRENDEEIIRTRKTRVSEEIVPDHKGRMRTYTSYKFPYVHENGEVYATGGISIDITDRKRAEMEAQQARLAAFHSSRLASLGEMAGGIAHEINNPLTIVSGFAQILEDRAKSGDLTNDELLNDLKRIDEAVGRIQKIIRGLNAFARDDGSDPFDSIPIGQIYEDLMGMCQERLHNHKIRFEITFDDRWVRLECRPHQIGQVILNLLNNARDAISNLSEKWIRIENRVSGNWLEIYVTDSGDGIRPEISEHLFDPFFTTKQAAKGTGLGLSISKSIIEDHAGSISVNSECLHTQFVVKIPLRQVNQ